MNHHPVRPGFPTASPFLVFRDPAKALAFYQNALGAEEILRADDAEGLRHAEFRLGDSTFMMTRETPSFPALRSIEEIGSSPVHFFLYLAEVDVFFQRALAAGCEVVMAIGELSYGRSGGFKDPFGHIWWISTHRESPETAS